MVKHRDTPNGSKLLCQSHGRRKLLSGAGKAALLGTITGLFSAALPRRAKAAGSVVGDRCLTVLYPNADDVRFDFDYYRDQHLPLIMRLYGKSIGRFELRKGLPAPDGAKPPYVAVVNIYVADQKAFEEAGAQHGQTLRDDVPNFSSVMPMFQMDEIYGLAET